MIVHPHSEAIVAAVRACVGTRFRVQGRAVGAGLDCVGVALIAARAAKCEVIVPAYDLSGDHEKRLDAAVAALDCTIVERAQPGDLLVLAPAAARRHLAIVTDHGVVHAHAGLRRVVEGPRDPAWALIGAWRFPEGT